MDKNQQPQCYYVCVLFTIDFDSIIFVVYTWRIDENHLQAVRWNMEYFAILLFLWDGQVVDIFFSKSIMVWKSGYKVPSL